MADNAKIYIMKLTSDEDVVGEVVGEDNDFFVMVKNPIRIAISMVRGEPQVGFAPFPAFSEEKEKMFPIPKLSVVYSYAAPEQFVDGYKQVFSGLVVPNKQIITG